MASEALLVARARSLLHQVQLAVKSPSVHTAPSLPADVAELLDCLDKLELTQRARSMRADFTEYLAGYVQRLSDTGLDNRWAEFRFQAEKLFGPFPRDANALRDGTGAWKRLLYDLTILHDSFNRASPDLGAQSTAIPSAPTGDVVVNIEATFPPGSTQPAVKTEPGGGDGGVGLTPEQGKAAFDKLKPAEKKAYWALKYAEGEAGRSLEDREAHEWLKENGIDEEKAGLGELANYEVPKSLDTFRHYVGKARTALDENKYTRRAGRERGRSIVRGDEIEHQRGDDE